MNIIKEKGVCCYNFDSMGEFLHFLATTPKNKHYKNSTIVEKIDNDGWSGTKTYEEAIKLATYGWDEVAEKMNAQLKKIPQPEKTTRLTPSYGVVGHSPSVPRYLQGIPTNMNTHKRVTTTKPITFISHGVCYSAGVPASAILKYGTEVLKAVRSLEAAQYSVKLFVQFCSNFRKGDNIACRVCIKQPNERLQVSKMAYPLANPSMLRRLFVDFIEKCPDTPVYHAGHGYPDATSLTSLFPKDSYLPEKFDADQFLKSFSKNH